MSLVRTNEAPLTRYTDDAAAIMERVLITGDLAKLQPAERVTLYNEVCRSVGLNPLTRPFEYIELDKKLTLYARKDATDQLRELHGVSIVELTERERGDVYIVTAKAQNRDGRTDIATGVVSLVKEGGSWQESQSGKRFFKKDGTVSPLDPDALANAYMKAETKAKRRVTLSICGLGWLDESELGTVASARPITVDQNTGEIIDQRPQTKRLPAPVADDTEQKRQEVMQHIAVKIGELQSLDDTYVPERFDGYNLDDLRAYYRELKDMVADAQERRERLGEGEPDGDLFLDADPAPRAVSDDEIAFFEHYAMVIGGNTWGDLVQFFGHNQQRPKDTEGWEALAAAVNAKLSAEVTG